jgi:23S rRNA pseudouridine1911/1915/1917 synthase
MTLLQWLEQHYPTAKRQNLKRMVEAGRVHINGKAAGRLKDEIPESAKVEVNDTPRTAAPAPPHDLEIIHEDPDLLIVNKPAGLLTSTVPREPRPTLVAKVRDYLANSSPTARLGIIHRLDRDASGLLVFSKNEEAYKHLKRQFFNHSVDRVYAVVVEGIPKEPEGTIRSKLIELPDGKVVATTRSRVGQAAVTEYIVLRHEQTPYGPRSLLRVKLQTGRKHQIRSQFAAQGTPIVNDPMYGEQPPTGRLMLVAMLLSLRHPRSAERLTWDIPIPSELKEAMSPATPLKEEHEFPRIDTNLHQ